MTKDIGEVLKNINIDRPTPPQKSEEPKKSELLDSKVRLIAEIQKEANVSNRQIKQMRRILNTRM